MFYSQFGEDIILAQLFRNKKEGSCVEVGAYNGIEGSNTYFFEQLGWNCILVEPDPNLCREIRRVRSRALLFECAATNQSGQEITLHIVKNENGNQLESTGLSTVNLSKVSQEQILLAGFKTSMVTVKTKTLDDIFLEAKIKTPLDFISIDVEGHEKEVLKGLSIQRWLPKIILIEDNSENENHEISQYLTMFGYARFKRTGVNDWYTLKSNTQWLNFFSRLQLKMTLMILEIKKASRKVPLLVKIKKLILK